MPNSEFIFPRGGSLDLTSKTGVMSLLCDYETFTRWLNQLIYKT